MQLYLPPSFAPESGELLGILPNKLFVADYPAIAYRGLLVDTGRHFLPVQTLVNTVLGIGLSKMNVLHWHISDDEAFPIDFSTEFIPDKGEPDEFQSCRGIGSTLAIAPNSLYSQSDVIQVVQEANTWGIITLNSLPS